VHGVGELFELWFDGAGSEGREYDWTAIADLIDELQPGAMIFTMGRPTIRWVGNEDGLAADPVEYVVSHTQMKMFTVKTAEFAEALYQPPECDVSIRPGWFYQPAEEPKSVEHLLAIYYSSIGLGANLLLNVPPAATAGSPMPTCSAWPSGAPSWTAGSPPRRLRPCARATMASRSTSAQTYGSTTWS